MPPYPFKVTKNDMSENTGKILPVNTRESSYVNVCDQKPEHGQTYIVADLTGKKYHIAFWDDDEMNFVNNFGILPSDFLLYIKLPVYTPII